MPLHYPITGLAVLAAGIAFMKGFDYLAAQSVQRLRDTARRINGTSAADEDVSPAKTSTHRKLTVS